MPPQNVIILGAGIIGLQTARTLLEAGHAVTLLAQHWPAAATPAYCSDWAGAQWRSHAAAHDARQQRWDRATYLHWRREIDAGRGEERGLSLLPLDLLYDSPAHPDLAGRTATSPGAGFWFAEFATPAGPVDSPLPVAAAFRFPAVFVDVPIYLAHLLRHVKALGARCVTVTLPCTGGLAGSLDAAAAAAPFSRAPVFVNALGLAARDIVPDPAVHPVRGQVLLVKGVAARGVSRQGVDDTGAPYIAYAIPRPHSGTTILGGCRERGAWEGAADARTTAAIVARAAPLVPALRTGHAEVDGGFEVVGTQVGLRPGRDGGARVEAEEVGERRVVHAYGVGGAGFQNSVGLAAEVRRLVEEP